MSALIPASFPGGETHSGLTFCDGGFLSVFIPLVRNDENSGQVWWRVRLILAWRQRQADL